MKFLGDPRVKLDPIQTEFGEIESMSFIYERNIIETYMVAYTDYPSMMVDASAPMALLQGAKEGSMLDGAEIDMEQEIEIKGYPGLYFKSTFDGIYSEYKLYLVENRLYQVAILRDGDYATPAESDEFFNSFQLIGLD